MSNFLNGQIDNNEIRQIICNSLYTSGYKPSKKLIDSIVEQFWFHDFYNSFISDKHYLDLLIRYLDKEKPKKFNRNQFYKYIFNDKVDNKKNLKLLYQIALYFEKNLTNSINSSDYEELIKTLQIPNGIFNIQWMESNHLGKIEEKEGKKFFIWEHHTLTEYLVSEYILKKTNIIDEIKKLVILEQDGVTAFISSWSGVLRFLLGSSKGLDIYKWFIEFLEHNKENVDDNISELITFTELQLPNSIKKSVFNLIYKSYFNRLVWMPVWSRSRLGKFIDKETYDNLKFDVKKWSNRIETYIKRGNVIAIIGGLLEHKNALITKKEKSFWERKLIQFINNPEDDNNGVLQRHSLNALAKYRKSSLIPLVSKVSESNDSLLRNEFIEFCIETNPNSKYSIDNFIKGIKDGSDTYARHGLYKINKKESIRYLLASVTNDEDFWKSFLEYESIYDKDNGDKQLLDNISICADAKIISSLKRIIFNIFQIHDIYQEDKSNFIRQIVLLIKNHDNNFVFEILDEINKQKDENKSLHLFIDFEETIAILLTLENLEAYLNRVNSLPSKITGRVDSVIYIAKRINGSIGEGVYKKAVKLNRIQPVDEIALNRQWEQQQNKRDFDTIKQFKQLLEPSPGKYIPNVFEYYLRNQKKIDAYFDKKGKADKARLIKLAIDDGIKKINPQKFIVTIPNKNSRQFTWSAVASYYGDILSIVHIYEPKQIAIHRQNIIDFIPFAYSDDMSLIIKMIDRINDLDLISVNQKMIDRNCDARYLVPGTYIYIVGHYAKKGCKLQSVLPVLKSFIGDEFIPEYEQKAAIEAISLFTDNNDRETRQSLNEILKNNQYQNLYEVINACLIHLYKDEKAIEWRINEIKKPLVLLRTEGVHTPGKAEMEIDWMAFAKPIMNLKDERFLDKIFEILDYSFTLLEEKEAEGNKKEYWEYINYLWRVVITFIDNLKEEGSFIPVLALEVWSKKHSKDNNYNWLRLRLAELKRSYINLVRPFDKLADGIEELKKSNVSAAKIAYFLFKAQFVETKLRNLVEGINYFLELASRGFVIYRKAENKRKFREFTLGQLKTELCKYKAVSLVRLDTCLSKFHDKRNEFTHELFLQKKSIHTLAEEAIEYTKDAEESLGLIQEVWKEILKLP